MSQDTEYHQRGIHFQYPANWELLEEFRQDTFTVSVSRDGTYWSVTVLKDSPRPEQVLSEAVETFQNEYEDVDEYTESIALSGVEGLGSNLEFVVMELISCVFMKAATVGGVTLFVMAQVADHERNEYESIFEKITQSLIADSPEPEAFEMMPGDDNNEEEDNEEE